MHHFSGPCHAPCDRKSLRVLRLLCKCTARLLAIAPQVSPPDGAGRPSAPLLSIHATVITTPPRVTQTEHHPSSKDMVLIMSAHIESLPPVIRILLEEPLEVPDNEAASRKYLRRLVPELSNQALWTLDNYVYIGENDAATLGPGFSVSPTATLNPFSWVGKCGSLECRIRAAEQFARSLGLYSDSIVIPDPFTTFTLDDKRWSADKRLQFLTNTSILKLLRPLIETGVIRFSSPLHALCSDCFEAAERKVTAAAQEVMRELATNVTYTLAEEALVIDSGNLYETPLITILPLTAHQQLQLKQGYDLKKLGMRLFVRILRNEMRQMIFTVNDASQLGTSVFSNSRLGVLALRQFGERPLNRGELDAWEIGHSALLPWIRDLTILQVVQLREMAEKALPRFRELVARSIAEPDTDRADSSNTFRELRQQTAEVKAELATFVSGGAKQAQNAYSITALAIAVYGFAGGPDAVAIAVPSLIALLQLIHGSSSPTHKREKLTTTPGYVLVKAQELLGHSSEH